MKIIITSFLLLYLQPVTILNTRFNTYTITGVMSSHVTKKKIRNAVFTINSDTIYTDENGKYSYKVLYVSGRGRGQLSVLQARRMRTLINSEFLTFKYSTKTIFVKNKWRKCKGKKDKTVNINLKW